MRDSHAPGPRSHRASHARPAGVAGRISGSVPFTSASYEIRRSVLESTRGLRRRLADARPWAPAWTWTREPAALRRIPRPRTIRAKVVCLLAVPIISLMTLWGLVAVQAAQSVYTLTELKQLNAAVQAPTDNLVSALQRERTGVARFLGAPASGSPDATLTTTYTATDTAAATLRNGAGVSAAAATGLGTDVTGRISTLLSDLAALPALRGEAAKRQVTWGTAQAGYTKAIEDALTLEGGLAAVLDRAGQNGQSASEAWPVTELARSREMLARQAAIVAYTQAANTGAGLSADDYRQFTGAYYSEYELQQAALPQLRGVDASAYRTVTASPGFQRLAAAQQVMLNAASTNTDVASAEQTLGSLAPAALDDVGHVVAAGGTAAVAQLNPYGHSLATKAGIGVVLGLIAVAACLLVSVWIGRGLVLELTGLRDSALDLARRRLPRAIARLRAGEKVNLEAEVRAATLLGAASSPASGFGAGRLGSPAGGQDEIGQVVAALATVHQAALRAALDRAEAISGVSGVFLNLARRSQVLLHRQLALLDRMERRIDDARRPGGPVPPGPPGDPHASSRRGPDHPVRRGAGSWLAQARAADGRGARRGRGGRGLRACRRAADAECARRRGRDRRSDAPARRAGRERDGLLAAAYARPSARLAGRRRLRAGDRGSWARHEPRGDDRSEPAARQRTTGRPVRQRPVGAVRGQPACASARYQGRATALGVWRDGGRRAAACGGLGDVWRAADSSRCDTGSAGAGAGAEDSARRGRRSSATRTRVRARQCWNCPDRRRAEACDGTATATAPAPATPAPAPAASAKPDASTTPDAPDGLPRRVRQANLAPGLRGEPDASGAAEQSEGGPNSRSPEQARATMAAYQKGWSLGRAAADSPDG